MASSKNTDGFSFLTAAFELVTVRVGQDEVEIPVYCELLSSVSPYFRNAFDGRFKEAADGTVPLLDTSEATFRIFRQWAHAQLHSSGRQADVPDLSILPYTSPVAKEATATSDGSDASATHKDANEATDEDTDEDNDDYDDTDDDDDSDDGEVDSSASTSSDDTDSVLLDKDFDEPDYHAHPMSDRKRRKLYFQDEMWVKHYNSCMMSYLSLFIFADKYSVHQLRDDIMTAILGQTHTWRWYPDPTLAFVSKAYANLPESATLLQFMVDSTASYWLTESDADLVIRLRDLHEWQPQFAFEVSLTLAKWLRDRFDLDLSETHFDETHSNSCSLHEHITHDKDTCRARVKKKAHVFALLIEACAGHGITLVKDQGKEDYISGPGIQTPLSDRQ